MGGEVCPRFCITVLVRLAMNIFAPDTQEGRSSFLSSAIEGSFGVRSVGVGTLSFGERFPGDFGRFPSDRRKYFWFIRLMRSSYSQAFGKVDRYPTFQSVNSIPGVLFLGIISIDFVGNGGTLQHT